MKKKLITFVSSLLLFAAQAQTFEGVVIYSLTCKSKNPQMTDQQWSAMMGNTQRYSIKGGDYKSVSNGAMFQWQLYKKKDNKIYNKMSNSETVYWNDGATQGDEVLSAELNKNATEVLGYKCDELILKCKSGVQKYYFNSALAVDPGLFAEHKYGNWHDFLSRSKALPLKSIIETAQFILESVATEVQPGKLDAQTFELPAGVKTEKSPY